jgi:dienelactone hydrolase
MRWLSVVVLVLGVAAVAADPGEGGLRHVSLTATPRDALVDAPVEIRATGLLPRRLVVLEATTRDSFGRTWRSRLSYRTSASGVVDTRSKMRLFWSMQPVGASGDLGMVPANVSRVAISLLSAGRVVAAASLTRRMSASNVSTSKLSVAQDGLAATFYAQPSSSRRPAVLQLGGSGSGDASPGGALLASHGYPTLSLAYFGQPGLPSALKDIPLEYFEKALQWLASQPAVDPNRITVIGVSRGGEAALLIAANYPDLIHGVIACTTGSHVLGAFPPPATGAAWTINGNAILTGLLPVDKISAPTLIYGGGKDEIIDSGPATKELVEFAHAHGRTNVTGKIYPNAGHGVGCRIPNIPAPTEFEVAPGTFLALGGTTAANSEAAAASWPARLRLIASAGK